VAPLALALQLALASPGLTPRLDLDPGPFGAAELAAASGGVFVGDVAVLGAAYLTLKLFANDTFDPSATNFRRAAYALGVAAVVIPPLTAVLLARWARREPADGATWKAMLLATAGQLAALGVGIATSPHYWAVLPVQLVAIAAGTSLGLHWGPRARSDPDALSGEPLDGARRPGAERSDPPSAPPPAAAIAWPGQCAVG
jgi:hypothetical protein